ncbi:MAG TPA: ferredoxin [Actinoplanes sp.]|jgi:ferredoxin|nr:ferredoxin [Actinoplanes sp.]
MSGDRLHIDWTACDGRGLCAELLPELLAEDDWGYPVARDGATEPAVPDHLVDAARRAIDRCPALALRLVRR